MPSVSTITNRDLYRSSNLTDHHQSSEMQHSSRRISRFHFDSLISIIFPPRPDRRFDGHVERVTEYIRQLYLIPAIILIFNIESPADEISWPYLAASDYLRGTTGERMFFNDPGDELNLITVCNETRVYEFEEYWDYWEEKQEHPYYDEYSRWINVTDVSFRLLKNLHLGFRFPYVSMENNRVSNEGWSDILLKMTFDMIKQEDCIISISSGVKLQTGYYDNDMDKLPLSSGSTDVPIILNTSLAISDYLLFGDVAFVIIGDRLSLVPEYYENPFEMYLDSGNEIYCDFGIFRKFGAIAPGIELNYFYYFHSHNNLHDDNYSSYKLGIAPGIVFRPRNKPVRLGLGYSWDLLGRGIMAGASPVVRIQFSI